MKKDSPTAMPFTSFPCVPGHGRHAVRLLSIGKEVKLDLTPLWLKLQTVKGCYAYRYNTVKDVRKQVFEIALDMIAKKGANVDDMLTHTFRIGDFRQMIEVNLHKIRYKAMKTAVSFMLK